MVARPVEHVLDELDRDASPSQLWRDPHADEVCSGGIDSHERRDHGGEGTVALFDERRLRLARRCALAPMHVGERARVFERLEECVRIRCELAQAHVSQPFPVGRIGAAHHATSITPPASHARAPLRGHC
jgi:hypothetical protein